MRLFIDTNVFVAAVVGEEERSGIARELLNQEGEFYTSVLNLMELRSVLSKSKGFSRDKLEDVEQEIVEGVDVVIPDSSDFVDANTMQAENLLYPFDAVIFTLSEVHDAELVSFDSELIDKGATAPEELVDI